MWPNEETIEMIRKLDDRGRLDLLVTLAHEADDLLEGLAEDRAAGRVDDQTAALLYRDTCRFQELAHVASDAGSVLPIAAEVQVLFARMWATLPEHLR